MKRIVVFGCAVILVSAACTNSAGPKTTTTGATVVQQDAPEATTTVTTMPTTPVAPVSGFDPARWQWALLEADMDYAYVSSSRGDGHSRLGDRWFVWGTFSGVSISDDLRTWTETLPTRVRSVAVGPAGAVAGGPEGLWFSETGDDWEQVGGDWWLVGEVEFFDDGYLVTVSNEPSWRLSRSTDGRTWVPALDPMGELEGGCSAVLAMAESYVLVTDSCDSAGIPGGLRRSTDGATWSDVYEPFGECVAGRVPAGVANRGDRVVFFGGCGSVPVSWVTEDGLAWERVDLPDLPPAEPGGSPGWYMEEVAATADGFVAVFTNPMIETLQVVASADGFAWDLKSLTAVRDSGHPPSQVWEGVCSGTVHQAGEATFVVARLCEGSGPIVWVSWDDMAWEPVPLPEPAEFSRFGSDPGRCVRGDWEFTSVIPDGDGFVFIGCGAWRWSPDATG